MSPVVAGPVGSGEASKLLFDDEEEVELDNVMLSCLTTELSDCELLQACIDDDDELLQAFVDEFLESDLPPVPGNDLDNDDDSTEAGCKKFDRDAVIGNKWLSCHKKLFTHCCWKVVKTKKWKKSGCMPGKGKDPDFDSFMQAIGCPKWKNASDAWLICRRCLGAVLPSAIFSDKDKMLDEHNKQMSNRGESIDLTILDARSCKNWMGCTKKQHDHLEACCWSAPFIKSADSMIGKLNEELTSALCGINAMNPNERVNHFA